MHNQRAPVVGGEGCVKLDKDRARISNNHDLIVVGGGCREPGVVQTTFARCFRVAVHQTPNERNSPNLYLSGRAEERCPAGQGGRGTDRRRGDCRGRGAGQRALAVAAVVGEADHHLQRLPRIRVGQGVGRTRPDAVRVQRRPVGGEPLPLVGGVGCNARYAVGVRDVGEVGAQHRRHAEHVGRGDRRRAGGGGVGSNQRHVVGVDLVVNRIGCPHGVGVGPDSARFSVAGGVKCIEVLVGVACLAGHVVGVEFFVIFFCYPHGDVVGPDSARIVVAGGFERIEVLVGVACLGAHVVGVNLGADLSGNPHGCAVGPDSCRKKVSGIEILADVARLGGHVVGVEFFV